MANEELFDINLYNDEFFEWHLKYAREYSMVTMDWLLKFIPFKSVVDFGCGIGSYLESAHDKNVKIKGYDIGGDFAKKYTPEGPGSVFSFGVKATGSLSSRQTGEKFINSVQLASHLANIGDVRTLVIHPASTTHRQLTDDQLIEAGVPQDLIRISVGLEDIEDILFDLDQALTLATGSVRS